MVEPKDVVVAILGSSAALGGFDLVFLGVVIASYQSYAGAVPEHVVEPYRKAGIALLGAFGLSLVTVATSLGWMVEGGAAGLYDAIVVLFGLLLVAVFGSAAWTARMVLFQ